MKLFFRFLIIGILSTSINGCMTFSGEKLSDLEPIKPKISPFIEESVGDFVFDQDGGKVVTSNKMGRLINKMMLYKWEDQGYISDFEYVKSEQFTGNAQYNLTLKGRQTGESNMFMQVISALTLLIIPHTRETTYDLTYELENVKTGKVYQAKALDSTDTIYSIIFLPALPFFGVAVSNTHRRIAEHVYQDFVKQGAFETERNTTVELSVESN